MVGEDISYVVDGARKAFRLFERDDGRFGLETVGLVTLTLGTIELRAHADGTELNLRVQSRAIVAGSALVYVAPLVLLFAGLAVWQLYVQRFAAAAVLGMLALAMLVVAGYLTRVRVDREVSALRSGFESMLGSRPQPAPEAGVWATPVRASARANGVSEVVATNEASMRRRSAALLLDISVIAVVWVLLNAAAGSLAPPGRATSIQQTVGLLVWTAGSAAYFLGSWLLGATPAMRLLGLGIVGRDGGGPGLVRSLIRLVVFAVEVTLIAFVTLIYLGLSGGALEEGLVSWATVLTWPAIAAASLLLIPADVVPHDRVAGTRVIRLSRTPDGA